LPILNAQEERQSRALECRTGNLKSTRLSAARVSDKIQHHKALAQQGAMATRIAAIECR
jgi:hypothetical protein